jgi:hypothetical protein
MGIILDILDFLAVVIVVISVSCGLDGFWFSSLIHHRYVCAYGFRACLVFSGFWARQ